MVTFLNRVKLIKDGDSCPLVPKGTLNPGVYFYKVDSDRSSIISTLWKISGSGQVLAEYFDFTTGEPEVEVTPIGVHGDPPIGDTDRIVMSKQHNKPYLKLTVSGGPVELSVYVTGWASSFGGLVRELQQHILHTDLGIALQGLDRVNNLYKFINLDEDGNLLVNDVTNTGNPFFEDFEGLSDPTDIVDMIDYTVPTDRALVLTRVYVSCTRSGTYRIFQNSDKIGGGRLDANRTESLFEFDPSRRLSVGDNLKIEFEALSPATETSSCHLVYLS